MNNGDSQITEVQAPRSFCAFCGKPIIPNAQFCSYCGKEQTMTGAEYSREVQAIPVTVVKKPIDKRAIMKTALIIIAIVLVSLSFIELLRMQSIEFKSNKVFITAYNGAMRTTIKHDLQSYHFWITELIFATIFLVAAIICLIIHIKLAGKINRASVIILLLTGVILLPMLLVQLVNLSERNEYYKMLKKLEDRPTYAKGFVVYDPHSDFVIFDPNSD